MPLPPNGCEMSGRGSDESTSNAHASPVRSSDRPCEKSDNLECSEIFSHFECFLSLKLGQRLVF